MMVAPVTVAVTFVATDEGGLESGLPNTTRQIGGTLAPRRTGHGRRCARRRTGRAGRDEHRSWHAVEDVEVLAKDSLVGSDITRRLVVRIPSG
jgi:hypothetical protein